MHRPLFAPLHRPIVSGLINAGGATAFSPLNLFTSGEQGAWYDPSDLSSLFQDAAGTTPVTAAGQPVGLMRDKSGRANHASQTTTASKPILRNSGSLWYLEFDGVDDFLVTGSVNFTATDKMSVFAGARKLSGIAFNMLLETDLREAGSFYLGMPTSGAYEMARAGGVAGAFTRTSAFAAPHTAVLAMGVDLAAATEVYAQRVNGVASGSVGSENSGVGPFGNLPLCIGRRPAGNLPFAGYLYGLIVRGALTDATGITRTERFMAAKSGVVL